MGYVSLSEDIANKFFDLCAMIDKSTLDSTPELQRERKESHLFSQQEIDEMYEDLKITKLQLKESRYKLGKKELESKNTNDEISKLRQLVSALGEQNENLKLQVNRKETLLMYLKEEISSIIKKNEASRKVAENKSHEILASTVNRVNDENAEIVLKLKSGIAQIGSIIQQQNFHKKAENINNIKFIIKKLTGLY